MAPEGHPCPAPHHPDPSLSAPPQPSPRCPPPCGPPHPTPRQRSGAGHPGVPVPQPRRAAALLPGTATLEMASGWLSVSTLTCWKPLQVALCRCLCPGGREGVTASPPDHHPSPPHPSGRGWVPAIPHTLPLGKAPAMVQHSETSRPPCPKASPGGRCAETPPQAPVPSYRDNTRTENQICRQTGDRARQLQHPSAPQAPHPKPSFLRPLPYLFQSSSVSQNS